MFIYVSTSWHKFILVYLWIKCLCTVKRFINLYFKNQCVIKLNASFVMRSNLVSPQAWLVVKLVDQLRIWLKGLISRLGLLQLRVPVALVPDDRTNSSNFPNKTIPITTINTDWNIWWHYYMLYVLFFQREHKHIFAFNDFPPHWFDTSTQNPSSSKRRTYTFYIVNIIAADVLAT